MKPRKEIEESLSCNSSMIMNNPDTVAICDAIRISTCLLLDIREILTTKEASKFCRVSERTLRRWIEEGLPHTQVKKGCKLLFFKRNSWTGLRKTKNPCRFI